MLFLSGCGRSVSPADTGAAPGIEETEETVDAAVSDDPAADAAASADVVIDDPYGTTYEIFVYSFADSDGDGIGDLNGITANLDYLNDGDPKTQEDLGVNALWLTPIFPSPTYHKYDATEYCDIDPAFGTLADLDALLAACHARGMRLYLDLAVNHTSSGHPWFRAATEALNKLPAEVTESAASGSLSESEAEALLAQAAEISPYVPYYNFSLEPQTGYEPLPGTDWYYEARFWSGMPDLNLDEEAVRGEIEAITRFWLDRGVDGFRLDAVTSYYTDDAERSEAFLAWLHDTVTGIKPDAYLVAEAWENQDAYAKLYASGVDSFFDFAFAGQEGVIAQVVRSGKTGQKFADRMIAEEELYTKYRDKFINAPFYTNHDMARSAGYYAKDAQNRVKLAMALNLMQSGNAFVYYGEELGMKGAGKDENKRAPFPWTAGASPDAAGSAEASRAMLCAGPPEMDAFEAAPYGSLAEQRGDPDSVYHYVRRMIHLRARHPLIARGRTALFDGNSAMGTELADHPAVCGFLRRGQEDAAAGEEAQLAVFINTSAEEQSILLSDGLGELADSLTVGEETVSLTEPDGPSGSDPGHDGDILTLPGYAVAVFSTL